MSGIWTLAKKELRHYFNSPMAYVVITVFLLVCGWFFTIDLFLADQASMRRFFATMPLILLFFLPAISMRLMADEKRQGTLELLVTQPLSDIQIVLGKFLGGLSFFTILLATTILYPIILSTLGDLDWGPVIGGYLGLFLTGAALLSIGLFTSSITNNQIVAFILGFLAGFTLFLLGQTAALLPPEIAGIVSYLGFDMHFNNIAKGLIDTRDLLYYFSLIVLMLFFSLQSLLNRKN